MKLKYRYYGSEHVWEHEFTEKRSLIEWVKTFKPFVKIL